ncbi:hypothetical protein GEV29_07970 [Aeromicrobium sp. SMF47]|nr:hypothetical protein [Aeromicrobium yanjiei]
MHGSESSPKVIGSLVHGPRKFASKRNALSRSRRQAPGRAGDCAEPGVLRSLPLPAAKRHPRGDDCLAHGSSSRHFTCVAAVRTMMDRPRQGSVKPGRTSSGDRALSHDLDKVLVSRTPQNCGRTLEKSQLTDMPRTQGTSRRRSQLTAREARARASRSEVRHMHDRIEIRMFGRLFVRRSNGEVVEADEWSTGKTTDLLRLLALNNNRAVSPQSIIDKLWPDVAEDKARASLRTAVSRVRHVLDEPCIERHLGGLVLRNAWVDVTAFQAATHDLSAALHAGDHARVVSLAREAEALYVADFRAHDDKSFWATQTRDSLLLSRQSVLADAGESALKLQWMRDAIDFSTLAVAEDPCFERPHRTLMQAHSALGETELALRAFEHLRVCLLQELGADPSPQTRALHIQMLSCETPPEFTRRPFIGRRAQVTSLAADLRSAIASDGCDVICLTGPSRSGREALLDAAVAQVEHAHLRHLIEDGRRSSAAERLARLASDRRSDITVWGPSNHDAVSDVELLRTFLAGLDPRLPRVIAVIASEEAGELLAQQLGGGAITVYRQTVGPLSDADLLALATVTLSAPPSPRLLEELRDQSGCLAGKAVAILREWIASGWIISTMSGVDLYNGANAYTGGFPVGDYFRTMLEQLSVAETELCQLLAVLDRPASGDALTDIVAADIDRPAHVHDLQSSLDELADLGILRVSPCGYEMRNRALRDAFEHRLRPAVKARLLRQVRTAVPHEIAAEA